MAAKINLSIHEPCHENWDKMTRQEQGRFCGSCQKQVVDFTRMNDEQLIAFFRKETGGGVCGRLNANQMHRDILIPKKRIPWLKYFFQVALPAFLVSSKVEAQGKIMLKDTVVAPMILGGISTVEESILEKEKTFKGIVKDEQGEILRGVYIELKEIDEGTVTNEFGEYEFDIPVSLKSITLNFTHIGSLSQEQKFQISKKLKRQTTVLKEDKNSVLMGFIVTPQKKEEKKQPAPSLTRQFMDSISTKFKIFPNPAKQGASLNIELKQMVEGYYRIELVNTNGLRIYQQQIWIDKDARVIDFEIPTVVPGNYLLSLVNKESGKILTEKLIIQ